MSQGRKFFTGLLLAGAIAGLGYSNWMAVNEAIDTSPVMPPVLPTPATTQDLTGTNQKTVTLNDISETVTRPLFNATRRPMPPPKIEENTAATLSPPPTLSTATTPPSNLRLIGTMRSGDKQRRALVQVENAPNAAWLEVGADAGGWRVSEIGEDHVVVEAGGARSTLVLHPLKAERRKQE